MPCLIKSDNTKFYFRDSNFDNTKFDVSTLSSIRLNSIPCPQIRLDQILSTNIDNAKFDPSVDIKFCHTKFYGSPTYTQLQQILFYCIEFTGSKFSKHLILPTDKKICRCPHKIANPTTSNPGTQYGRANWAWLRNQITVDKMAEQQQMVLFIR